MSIIRLYTPESLHAGALLTPPETMLHYLLHVRRVAEGDTVLLFNGREGEWQATIHQPSRKMIALEVQQQVRKQAIEPEVVLAFAPIKHGSIDFMAQKATELGVSCLQPVMTEYTAVSRVNVERLRANAIEAAEQSERLTVPEVREASALARWLAERPAMPLLFADESGEGKMLGEVLNAMPARFPVAVLIGPEGGFSPTERTLIATQPGVLRVSLGARILRADTAALAVLAAIQLA